MKIFDWVHRRIHTNVEYCRVPHHKKDPYVGVGGSEDDAEKKAETEKEALLMDAHHVTTIQQVLEGILTIGTLGHLDYQCQEEFLEPPASKEEEEEEEEEEETEAEEEKEEAEAVELPAASAGAQLTRNLATESFKKEMLEKVAIGNGNVNVSEEEGDILEPLLKAINANKRERITLADLFLASDDNLADKGAHLTTHSSSASAKVPPEKEVLRGAVEVTAAAASSACRAKRSGSMSFTKKLSSWKKGGEDSPPATKKFHRMITRMLKKKIHPEMARDVQASAPGVQACRRDKSIAESASLI